MAAKRLKRDEREIEAALHKIKKLEEQMGLLEDAIANQATRITALEARIAALPGPTDQTANVAAINANTAAIDAIAAPPTSAPSA